MALQVVRHDDSTTLLPFDVVPELEAPPVVVLEDPDIARALDKVKVSLEWARALCAMCPHLVARQGPPALAMRVVCALPSWEPPISHCHHGSAANFAFLH